MADELQRIATTALGGGTPDAVQQAMDDTAKWARGKIWRGMWQVAASGFGKGLLATAAIFVAGGALAGAVGAYGGIYTLQGLAPTIGQGIVYGAAAGANFLATGLGMLTLAVGGLFGTAMEVRGTQNKITAEMAQAQAQAYELMRSRQQVKEVEKQRSDGFSAPAADPEPSFAARETARRKTAAQGLAK